MDIKQSKDPSISFPTDEAFLAAIDQCPTYFSDDSHRLAEQLRAAPSLLTNHCQVEQVIEPTA